MAATLPIDSFVDKTVQLAKRLSETDVSIPNDLTQVEKSLIDLRTSVLYSRMDQQEKNRFIRHITDIKDSVNLTTNITHKILASFVRALSKLEIFSSHLLRLLTNKKVKADDKNETESKFEEVLQHTKVEVDRITNNAEDVYRMLGTLHSHLERLLTEQKYVSTFSHIFLENLMEKISVLNSTVAESQQTDTKNFDEDEHDLSVEKICRMTIREENVNKNKYQRNLEVFDQFPE
ncbi:unnamed protein product [Adineta steineri]|uniref:Uncharacterized protein n=2 Tax=Adineta steineri TaxID=433720 RepID=A0A815S0Q4_9BILA|nr:unnamed protein product [Adineta steineri]CAF1485708.1 unnamed protein product [Adineta steineri]